MKRGYKRRVKSNVHKLRREPKGFKSRIKKLSVYGV